MWLEPLTVVFTIDLTRRFASLNATFLSHTFTQGDKDMLRNFSKLIDDEQGFVISAELVLVMTIAVLGMVVGLTAVRDSITQELNDISHAFGAVNQSYNVNGLKKELSYGGVHAYVAGFGGSNDALEDAALEPNRRGFAPNTAVRRSTSCRVAPSVAAGSPTKTTATS